VAGRAVRAGHSFSARGVFALTCEIAQNRKLRRSAWRQAKNAGFAAPPTRANSGLWRVPNAMIAKPRARRLGPLAASRLGRIGHQIQTATRRTWPGFAPSPVRAEAAARPICTRTTSGWATRAAGWAKNRRINGRCHCAATTMGSCTRAAKGLLRRNTDLILRRLPIRLPPSRRT
jgi:hypothetical protein